VLPTAGDFWHSAIVSEQWEIHEIRAEFARLVEAAASEPPLARTALLIAAEENPALDAGRYEAELARYVDELGRRIAGEIDPYLLVGALNEYLFKEQGYTGNADRYYDPRNSFLDQVIERRTGIPISLTLIYVEVGRGLGLPVHGLGLPGHFLATYLSADEQLVIDCFDGGNVIVPGKLATFMRERVGDDIPWSPDFLEPVSNRAFLARLLSNLKGIYMRRRDLRRALAISDRLILVEPGSAREYRDRGMIQFQLSQYGGALPDLERYLELQPDAPDADKVRLMVQKSRDQNEQTE
jgi:regulator of sirC expression with transglutaminase-like and TPR domain